MKLKSIILISKNDNILYKIACHAYNMPQMKIKRIEIIDNNKAVIYYQAFKIRMDRGNING